MRSKNVIFIEGFRYEILNYKGKEDGYVLVGDWRRGTYKKDQTENVTLKVNMDLISWYDGSSDVPESICTPPCKMGEIKVPFLAHLFGQSGTLTVYSESKRLPVVGCASLA